MDTLALSRQVSAQCDCVPPLKAMADGTSTRLALASCVSSGKPASAVGSAAPCGQSRRRVRMSTPVVSETLPMLAVTVENARQ